MRRFNPEKELKKIQKGNKNKIIISVIALLIIIAIGSSYALYQVRYFKRIIYTKVGDFSRDINILAVFVDNDKLDNFPTKEDEVVYDKIVCDDNSDNHVTAYWDYDAWGLVVKATKKAKCSVYFKSIKANDVIDFAYNGTDGSDGTIQTFVVPVTGRYKLEVWGAQGGVTEANSSVGGLGGYSVGEITLTKGQILYIGVGGQGESGSTIGSLDIPQIYSGGFNGGGNGGSETDYIANNRFSCGGGGATHIAKVNGLLKTLSNKKDNILIVAAGGGGSGYTVGAYGGSGGGFQGGNGINTISPGNIYMGTGATQTESGDNVYPTPFDTLGKGVFGQGGSYSRDPGAPEGNGGGGGYYGGGGSSRHHAGAGGGSGYIGNTSLTNKVMYCYQCTPSEVTDTRTLSTNAYSANPVSASAKQGNGAARITYLGS